MTKRELLQSKYEMACHNLLCYSANYGMTEPRAGFEKEWEKAVKECELLKIMLNEYPKENKELQFIGTVSSTNISFNKINQEQYIESLVISDRDYNNRMFSIDYKPGKELLTTYDTERHKRYDLNKNTEILFTINNFDQCITKWEWLE